MKSSVAQNLGIKINKNETGNLYSADGSPIPIQGSAYMTIRYKGQRSRTKVLFCERLAFNCIICWQDMLNLKILPPNFPSPLTSHKKRKKDPKEEIIRDERIPIPKGTKQVTSNAVLKNLQKVRSEVNQLEFGQEEKKKNGKVPTTEQEESARKFPGTSKEDQEKPDYGLGPMNHPAWRGKTRNNVNDSIIQHSSKEVRKRSAKLAADFHKTDKTHEKLGMNMISHNRILLPIGTYRFSRPPQGRFS